MDKDTAIQELQRVAQALNATREIEVSEIALSRKPGDACQTIARDQGACTKA